MRARPRRTQCHAKAWGPSCIKKQNLPPNINLLDPHRGMHVPALHFALAYSRHPLQAAHLLPCLALLNLHRAVPPCPTRHTSSQQPYSKAAHLLPCSAFLDLGSWPSGLCQPVGDVLQGLGGGLRLRAELIVPRLVQRMPALQWCKGEGEGQIRRQGRGGHSRHKIWAAMQVQMAGRGKADAMVTARGGGGREGHVHSRHSPARTTWPHSPQ